MQINKIFLLLLILNYFNCKEKEPVAYKEPAELIELAESYILEDRPSVKKYKFQLPDSQIPAVPQPPHNTATIEGVRLGRFLFYDSFLSKKKNISCSSCHHQKYAFSDVRKFSPGVHGALTTRNSMSLVNLAWGHRFFWDGRVSSLEDLVLAPILNNDEMDMNYEKLLFDLNAHTAYPILFRNTFEIEQIDARTLSFAIAQFLRSIISFSAPVDKVRLAQEGLIREEDLEPYIRSYLVKNMPSKIKEAVSLCAQCHRDHSFGSIALYGGTAMRNNGLMQFKTDKGLGGVSSIPEDSFIFKVPTLRNTALTPPYMHDGRFSTLEDVIDHYSEHVQFTETLSNELRDAEIARKLNLTQDEKKTLIRYISYMTDKNLITNKEYASPFLADTIASESQINSNYILQKIWPIEDTSIIVSEKNGNKLKIDIKKGQLLKLFINNGSSGPKVLLNLKGSKELYFADLNQVFSSVSVSEKYYSGVILSENGTKLPFDIDPHYFYVLNKTLFVLLEKGGCDESKCLTNNLRPLRFYGYRDGTSLIFYDFSTDEPVWKCKFYDNYKIDCTANNQKFKGEFIEVGYNIIKRDGYNRQGHEIAYNLLKADKKINLMPYQLRNFQIEDKMVKGTYKLDNKSRIFTESGYTHFK